MQRLGVTTASPGVVRSHDIDSMAILQIGHVVQSFDRIGGGATGRAEKLERNHRDVPIDADDPSTVASRTSNRSSDVCSVGILARIKHAVVIRDKIPSAEVVDVPVAIVVDPVACDLERIEPHVVHQVRVRKLDSFVDDTNDNIGVPNEVLIPCLFCLAAEQVGGVCRANRRWSIVAVHAPETSVGVVGVIADHRRAVDVVGLDIQDVRVLLDGLHCRFHVGSSAEGHSLQNSHSTGLHGFGVNCLRYARTGSHDRQIALTDDCLSGVLHQEFIRDIFFSRQQE